MKPSDLAKCGSEHGHQAALCCWVRLPHVQQLAPAARKIYAIPNGGGRSKGDAAKLKAEGVTAGIPDLHLPVPLGRYPGLYIEMKKPGEERTARGGLSEKQEIKIAELRTSGYCVVVCYSWQEAALTIARYLQVPELEHMIYED